ncbi:transcriptional attenuator, LytR family [Cryobacterium psychrotolerans]|uniref:Transcriptional attenuator, LytR family n=1 Tax=Cryobacterium psychrotolerans TaxID=386301 RepID=A0A1G9BW45_9MICO|nr:LCP family protein [Cryobacterium psychrotolerans]TFD84108.1 LytR family transcriptional regulator [Cryobacterium psychrotolerans]SDK43603.1 transcriptional attenuator, LytR family [Cryobacterium psychrotolerans]
MTDIFSGPGLKPKPARTRASKRKRGRIALIAIGAVLLLVGGIVGVYAWTLSSTFDGTEKIAGAFPTDDSRRPLALTGDAGEAQNILLLGSDTHGSNNGSLADMKGQRSDTIMIAHIPADRKNIYVMSILRDSWLDIPGRGQAKINAALAYGGVPLAVETIEGVLGARIDHVAIVDFTGFKGITDALGGVDIDSQVPFKAGGHQFSQGVQHVDGEQALSFVRERKSFNDGDFQRARNQQAFIKAVLTKTLSAETLTNPGKISGLVGAVAPFLAVDQGLTSGYVASLGVEMRDVRVGNVTFFTMPTLGTGTSPDGQSIVNIDWEELKAVQKGFQTDTLDTYEPKVQTIG